MTPETLTDSTASTSTNGARLFLHLSDIHFHKRTSNDPYDLDVDLRRQLLRDAIEAVEEGRLGKVTAILVTGDIAFSGQEKEYMFAADWLDSLAEALNCHPKIILTTPGNHDIDRGIYGDPKEETLRMWHDRLRNTAPEALDGILSALLRDPTGRAKIYEPLKNYNLFAVNYGCDINPERPCWERVLDLDEHIILRIRGLNSVLTSNPKDDPEPKRLCLGEHQVQVDDDKRVIHLTLCHHPPDWLIDHDKVHEYLSERVHLQLFGHKHSQRVDIINNRIRMTAGAVHPGRGEINWLPRYNFIQIWTTYLDEEHFVHFRIYPRVWKGTRFGPDYQAHNRDFIEHTVNIGRIISTSAPSLGKTTSPASDSAVPILSVDEHLEISFEESVEVISDESRAMSLSSNYAPVLVRRFLNLGVYERNQIIEELGLDKPPGQGVSEHAFLKLMFSRAKERQLLGALWERVEAAHHDGLYQFNPFVGK